MSEPTRRRQIVIVQFPPVERHFVVHYRDDVPVGLMIDGKCYGVRPQKRGGGFRSGDELITIIDGCTIV